MVPKQDGLDKSIDTSCKTFKMANHDSCKNAYWPLAFSIKACFATNQQSIRRVCDPSF